MASALEICNIQVECLEHYYALPNYQTKGAAGADLYAANQALITVQPMQRCLVPTGLKIMLPSHYEAQIRPRSGLALRNGIILPNSPATIDSDYRGELQVIIMNLNDVDFIIERGMRIAQIIFSPISQASFTKVNKIINDTDRGEDGFGSTGIKG